MHRRFVSCRFYQIEPSLFVALAMSLAAVSSARALDVFNTLGSTGATQNNVTGGANRQIVGSSFDLSGATLDLISATFNLRGTSGGGNIPFLASIFSSTTTSTQPTTWLADFPVTNAAALGNVTFTLGSVLTLAANQRYWLVLANTSNGAQGQYTYSASPTDSVGNSYVTFANQRTSLLYSNTTGLTTMNGISFSGASAFLSTVLFSVNGTITPVPEPGAYALAATAITVLSQMARRRRRKADRA